MASTPAELLAQIAAFASDSELSAEGASRDGRIVFLRHAERGKLKGSKADRDAEPITPEGMVAARQLGTMLRSATNTAKSSAHFLYMGSERVHQTACFLAGGWIERAVPALNDTGEGCSASFGHGLIGPVLGLRQAAGVPEDHIGQLRLGDDYETYKVQHGWDALVEGWLSGTLPEGLMVPPETLTVRVLQAVARLSPRPGTVTMIATHDVFIFGLLKGLRGVEVTRVDFLGGFSMSWEELRVFLASQAQSGEPAAA